jgi:hypothetical protein
LRLKLRIFVVQSPRHSTGQNSVAPTIEDIEIKQESDEQIEDGEVEGEENEDREEHGASGFRRHYRMGLRRAHIVRSVEVDGY